MASEKKPSIYDDRGSIGSSKELDEYGVWVKSEPQDIDAGESGFSLPDFPAETDSLPDFDLNLEEPPSFGEDFSIEDEETAAASGGDESLDESLNDESLNMVDFDKSADEFDLELPDLPDEDSGPDLSDLPDLSDFSLDEEPASSGGEIYEDLSINTEADKDITSSEGLSLSEGNFDLSLDSDFEESAGTDEGSETASSSDDEAGFTELPLEDILGDISLDIPGADTPEEPEAEKQEASADLSTELLKKIVEELSSIRSELSLLKNEFSVIRPQVPATEEQAARGRGGFFDQGEDDEIALTGDELNNIISTAEFTEEAGADANEEAADGFSGLGDLSLPEEDLPGGGDTGTEAGALEEAGAAADTAVEEIPLPGGEEEELSLEDLDLSFGEAAEDEPDADKADATDINDDFLVEDISFEGLETAETEDEESLDLSNAVIDEPDLGSGIQENPVEEPPEDISLDIEGLDGESGPGGEETEILMEEEAGFSIPEEALEAELPEDLPAAEPEPDNSLDQLIPEGFMVEEDSQAPFVDNIEEQESLSDIEDPDLLEGEAEEAPAENFTGSSGKGLPGSPGGLSGNLKQEIKTVLGYMDKLLEALPEKKIEEFAKSEYFDTYKKIFKELGLV
ncbi:MAG: hypothetical protein LBH26_01135 [Treponema sp.]|jgi:hypothetical protein|nr:hypothetical protein [Treponema sp.]